MSRAKVPDLTAEELDLRILSRNVTDADAAAVTAVLRASLAELAADLEQEGAAAPSAWRRSQRSIRGTLTPGRGAWRSFSG
jgi:hypothetical protein